MKIEEIEELFTTLTDEINEEREKKGLKLSYPYLEFMGTLGKNPWRGIGCAGFFGSDGFEVFPDHLSILPPDTFGTIKDDLIPDENKIYYNSLKEEIKSWLIEKIFSDFCEDYLPKEGLFELKELVSELSPELQERFNECISKIERFPGLSDDYFSCDCEDKDIDENLFNCIK